MQGKFYPKYGKRIFDLFLGLVGIVLISPLFLLIGIVVYLREGWPVFFTQTRVGKNFKSFQFYKFRTMIIDVDKTGPEVTKDMDARITRTGRFLRKTKLDELPQIINVLRGDISIIGPRPEVTQFVEIFREEYKEILSIHPGIADFATLEFPDEEVVLKKYDDLLKGYVEEVLPQKISLYKKYIQSISLKTDVIILFKSLRKLIR